MKVEFSETLDASSLSWEGICTKLILMVFLRMEAMICQLDKKQGDLRVDLTEPEKALDWIRNLWSRLTEPV